MKQFLYAMALAPIWYPHYLYRRWVLSEKKWTIQKSLDYVWTGDYRSAEIQRFMEREQNRSHLPEQLYFAEVCLEYGRIAQAQEEVESFLRDNPGDQRAIQIQRKIESFN